MFNHVIIIHLNYYESLAFVKEYYEAFGQAYDQAFENWGYWGAIDILLRMEIEKLSIRRNFKIFFISFILFGNIFFLVAFLLNLNIYFLNTKNLLFFFFSNI